MADNDSDHSDVDTSEKNCMYTNCNATSSYESTPCACTKLCRKHAMKMGTGGRCKVCDEMFAGVRRIRTFGELKTKCI
eukprot:m.298812 g.298812  ORF g.298812 m.298812 type:complete len:78 (-) comp20100_c0_seq2:735-968(-)